MSGAPIVLAITGMHRSGTSMVAHYLQRCGVDIGQRLQPADIGNPRGYFEDVDFLNFHQDLLSYFGLSIFPTNARSLSRQIPDRFRLRAHEILTHRAQSAVWGWKDCRTALFLEFWKEMVPDIEFIFLFRHPVLVVDSLLRRGTDAIVTRHPVIAFQSWRLHNRRILEFYCRNQSSCFLVDIDSLVTEPYAAVSQLFSKLSAPLLTSDFGAVYAPDAFKQESSLHDVVLMSRYPFQTVRCLSLYRRMIQLADWR